MNNLFRIVRKELRVALRERLVLALGAIIGLLLGLALYAGYLSYQQQRATINETQQEKRQEWLEQGNKHPHIAAHYGAYAFKPKTVLSLFDFGLDSYTGTSVYLEAHHQHGFMFRPAQDHSSMIRFGELSTALVLRVLVPLLIIFLAFSSYTRERESGTLKLLLSQGLSLTTLTWGKILAYCTLLLIVLAPFFAGIIVLACLDDQSVVIPDTGTRGILLALTYSTYLFVFVSLSVWVSSRSATGRNALLTLLSCWILLTMLVPKAVANLSENFYEVPSMREFKAAVERDKASGVDGIASRTDRVEKLKAEYLKKYEVDSVQQLPLNFNGISMQAGEAYGDAIYDHHLGMLRATFSRQQRMSSIASLINPVMAVQHLSMAFSGTDTYTFTDFEQKVEHYRRDLISKMNMDMAENSAYGEFYEYAAGSDLWQEVDDFSYQAPTAREMLKHYRIECISLLTWLTVTLLLIFYTNKKVKPLDG